MAGLTVYNVLDVASDLDGPLSVADLAYLDALLISVYLHLGTAEERVRLGPGEFTIVPRGAFYHLYSNEATILVQVRREARP